MSQLRRKKRLEKKSSCKIADDMREEDDVTRKDS